jgi:glycosyltransferase involved in cell wall biosynthesis
MIHGLRTHMKKNTQLRILLVNTRHFYGGGDSTYTFHLADLLRSKGHVVSFFAMQDDRNIHDPNADLFVSHIDFNELNRNKDLLNGFRVLHRAIYSTEARRKFRQLLERFHPNLVHLQSIHAHITPSVIFEARRNGVPIVWTLHDHKLVCPNTHFLVDRTSTICLSCGKYSFYRAVLRRCKKSSFLASAMATIEAYAHLVMGVRRRVNVFLAPSVFLRRALIDRGISPQKVEHLPYFLPDHMFQKQNQKKDYLLFMGRLELIKGIVPLLDACRRVPEVSVVIAGQVREPVASLLPKLLPPNARYVGMKQAGEIQQILSNSGAVVVPSLCIENQPFSILEAFAAGKPVIVCDLGGMKELVESSNGGLLVPPGDVQALAAAMQWMQKHPDKAAKLGQNARHYVRQEHAADRHYERLINLYERVMEENRGFLERPQR